MKAYIDNPTCHEHDSKNEHVLAAIKAKATKHNNSIIRKERSFRQKLQFRLVAPQYHRNGKFWNEKEGI